MPQTSKNMRILELCHYSAGGCGVWARVREESLRLAKKGHEVKVFSSYFEKGTHKILSSEGKIGDVKIQRFPATKLGGEGFMHWDFEKEALQYEPEIIIAHNYRQPHTTKALKIARKINKRGKKCKVFLVTHAPFVEGNITRSVTATVVVKFYDKFIGPRTLNKFEKILTISNWEEPYLLNAGAKKEKIEYIPNGIPEEFYQQKKSKEENKILFLGRVAPKKKIETLIGAIPFLEDKKVEIEIVGPKEEPYFSEINKLIDDLNVRNRVKISDPIYEIKEKIKKLDSAKIYALPSRVEGMPQSLIEAMAREKIVIGSDSIAIRDLINDGKTGFLFEFNNPKDLARKLDLALSQKNESIKKEARKFVEKFSWDKIIDKIEKTISNN